MKDQSLFLVSLVKKQLLSFYFTEDLSFEDVDPKETNLKVLFFFRYIIFAKFIFKIIKCRFICFFTYSLFKFENNDEKIQMKTNVSEIFITFLIKTLTFSLSKLARKIADENSKNFVEFFLSVAYFRIPKVIIF